MTDTHRPDLTDAPARKALGQHFLFDPSILHRTALAAGPVKGRVVIEVGPGPGGLTRALLDEGAGKVIAVETDSRFADALLLWPEAKDGRLIVLQKDARKVNFEQLVIEAGATEPAMIIGNLPYNVGTPLLVGWLKAGDWRGEMALMFQKEVAERICAAPGTDHYGRLAVLAQSATHPHIAFTLPPGAFTPPPKVDTGAAFGQRRKMMRAALKPFAKKHGMKAADWLTSVGIDPTARAETLSQDDFRRLAASLAK
jgi:16S rRNA (adenine1518-N6/adenine1519-N6)-dimethyltransferase